MEALEGGSLVCEGGHGGLAGKMLLEVTAGHLVQLVVWFYNTVNARL